MSKSERVLLVNPTLAKVSSTSFFVMPPGILCLAAYLRKSGFEVEILDCNVEKGLAEELIGVRLKNSSYLLIGVSVMVAGQLNQARSILQEVKKNSTITTVLGGAHVSQFPKEILINCPEVDYVVIGEGEKQLQAIAYDTVYRLNTSKYMDGVAFRKGVEVVVNDKESYIQDLNSVPPPAYDLLDFEKYRQDTRTWHNPYKVDLGVRVPIVTSRGCPNQCTFCSVSKCMGREYRALNPKNVVDLMQSLYEYVGAHYFAFFDANFTQDPPRVMQICNEIKRRDLKFQIDLPTGFPINVSSEEMVTALVEIGLIRTGISIESGDKYIRNDVMKKNVAQEAIFNIVDMVRKFPQVIFLVDIVIGMPEDTKETIETTYQIVEQLDIDEIVICTATPYGGTPLYEQCVKEHLFFEGVDPSLFWCSEGFSHHEVDGYIIKPYALEIEDLEGFKKRFQDLRVIKNNRYKKRMLDVFGVVSEWKGRG